MFAEQRPTGAWTPVRRALEEHDLERHVAGEWTIGFYCLAPDSRVRSIVFDIDAPKAMLEPGGYGAAEKRQQLQAAATLRDGARDTLGAPTVVEVSGRKGVHTWVVFGDRIPAADARLAGEEVLERAGFTRKGGRWTARALPAAHVELFPKQDRLDEGGLGNLVKLPLGVHQVTGRRSILLDDDLKPTADPWALLEELLPR